MFTFYIVKSCWLVIVFTTTDIWMFSHIPGAGIGMWTILTTHQGGFGLVFLFKEKKIQLTRWKNQVHQQHSVTQQEKQQEKRELRGKEEEEKGKRKGRIN